MKTRLIKALLPWTTVLLLLSVACSTQAPTEVATTEPPAAPPVTNTPKPPSPTPTEEPPSPTPTEVPPSPTATEVPPTPTDTPVPAPSKPGDVYYKAAFSTPLEGWDYFQVDSRNFKIVDADPANYKESVNKDRYRVQFEKTFIYLYLIYKDQSPADVHIDATVENLGKNNNNVSLICRYSDLGWYEFNIANNGKYNILRYEQKSKDYLLVYSGGSKDIVMGQGVNQYGAVCKGSELILYINGVETRKVTDKYLKEGYSGVSFSSFNTLPIILELVDFTISFP